MSTVERVRAHIAEAPDLSRVRRKTVAAALCMAPSTLGRHLQAEGVCFLNLIDTERKRRCDELLKRNRRADLRGIQRVTGVSSAHASRCVKRWFGATLPEYRSGL